MRGRHHRIATLLAAAVAAATPAFLPPVAAGSGGMTGEPESAELLLNDVAHFRAAAGVRRTDDQPPAPIVVRVDGGFDWAAAGVGAAGLLGLVLVVGAGMSAIRRPARVDEAAQPERVLGKGL